MESADSLSSTSSSSPDYGRIYQRKSKSKAAQPSSPPPVSVTTSHQVTKYSPLGASSHNRRHFPPSSSRRYVLLITMLGAISFMGSLFTLDLLEAREMLLLTEHSYHRIVFLEDNVWPRPTKLLDQRIIEGLTSNTTMSQEGHIRGQNCIFPRPWQNQSFPNCNTFHEIDMLASTDYLGRGWFRTVWKHHEDLVLKTLRLDREFIDEYYELHRRDALAMERLTYSKFVMDIYGYCGQSAMNEVANFRWNSLESLNRRMRSLGYTKEVNQHKLQIAASVAMGVAQVHEEGLVHYDLNPRNVAMVNPGRPKLNDFNICEFCPEFPSRFHEPWWRAPEEMMKNHSNVTVNHKVDVYALGNLLFSILTTRSPRGKMKAYRLEYVRDQVMRGVAPVVENEEINQSEDPALLAIRHAMNLCYEPNPEQRPTSSQVAQLLLDALKNISVSNEQL